MDQYGIFGHVVCLSVVMGGGAPLGRSGFMMARVASLDTIDKVYIKSRSGMGPASGG